MARIVRISDKVSAKIEGEDPLDKYDLVDLATSLAQHIQAVNNYRIDTTVFANRANIEKKKAAEARSLIEEIRDRKINPPVKKSRMDPLDSYDESALAADAVQHERYAIKFLADSQEYASKAEKEQKLADEVQRLINLVRKHKNKSN